MITEQMLTQALAGDFVELRSLPKTDLHSHSVLACDPSLFRKLLGPDHPMPKQFGSLATFLTWVHSTIEPLIKERDLALLTLASATEVLKRDGVTEAEISLHLPLAKLRGTSWAELAPHLERVRSGAEAEISFELGIPRPVTDELLREEVPAALDTGLFSGIDIYDDELACSLERFEPVIREARARGLYVKIHSGEIGEPKRMWDDIRRAEPDAIQHGVRAVEDPELLRFLARERIPLHVCPTSNIQLGVAPTLKEHPIRKLFDEGALVTVNTDDYVAFQSTVSEEYLALFREGVFQADELEQIRMNGFRSRQEE